MDITYHPDPSHLSASVLNESTGEMVYLSRPTANPGADFNSTREEMRALAAKVQETPNVFAKVLANLPLHELRASLQHFLDDMPEREPYILTLIESGMSIEEANQDADRLKVHKAFALKAVSCPDEELSSQIQLIQIDIQDDEYVVYCGNQGVEFTFVAIPMSKDVISMTQEQLDAMFISVEGQEVCPHCAAGVPHPDSSNHQPPAADEAVPQPVKRTLH